MRIRIYQAEDRSAVIALWKACGLLAPQNDPEKDIDRKTRCNPEGFLVGAVGGNIVATCMAGYDGHRGWINYLSVSPDHRRRGLGAQMLAAAETLLRKAGCPKINLQIRSTNTDALAFYAAIGFSKDDVVSMGKRLEVD
jgi:ribosomal protein S18 acetylase RimI-like enzyme